MEKNLSVYACALVITIFGGLATMLIIDVANTAMAEAEYTFLTVESPIPSL